MEAVPRLPMISCDIKISPSNTDFGHALRKYIRDYYHEDAESYTKEIKDLESLRQNAIKAPMDFTGCSILKRYYSQLHKLQSRFPMTDDGPACVPFMWTDIYSGVAYNITDIEYEEACILYNIGALHSKLGTMDSRGNAEGMKIACTHFQCSAWAFQHLRDTYPQPKGSDMSHDLLTFFINIMLAQAQECILEKSMLDSRKSSITAKIAAQVVDYYKCALGIMVSGSPSTDTGSILDIVGSKIFKGWKKFIEFKISYYGSISHLYMGNQAEDHEKWGDRVAWFQSANDHLTEAFKVAKNLDRDDLNEPLAFTMDVIGGKLNSSKKENEFVYHDKVPAITSLPELKGASLVKGIPFSISDPDVSGPDIFALLVPMEAHETSSLYSEEKAKLLRLTVSKIEGKNEELMAYLSSLNLEMSFEEEEKIPQELLEKCAAMSVRPNAISDLQELMKELMSVSKDVDSALKSAFAFLMEEERRELKHQEVFGKRSPSLLIMELKKECSKYEEAHKKAVESNNTLETAVNIHINNMSKLLLPLEELAEMLPSINALKTSGNVKAMDDFNHLINKVEEMKKQRIYLEQQLRDALMKDDITTDLVTLKKKEDLQQVFTEGLKKHVEITTYLDQNLTAQDNILCALTEANAHYAETRAVITDIKHQRIEMVNALSNSFEAYDDIVSKAKKGLEFYQKLQANANRLLTRIRGVTKVQEEERAQIAEVRNGPRIAKNPPFLSEPHVPKLKDYLPYLSKNGGRDPLIASGNAYASHHIPPVQMVAEPMRQATLGGPATDFNRKPSLGELTTDTQSIGVRPTPVGSEQPSVSTMCVTTIANSEVGNFPFSNVQHGARPGLAPSTFSSNFDASQIPYIHALPSQITSSTSTPLANASVGTAIGQHITYNGEVPISSTSANFNRKIIYQMPASIASVPQNCTSLAAIPSIPSQVNSSYAPSTATNVSPASVPTTIYNSGFQSPVSNYASNAITRTGALPYPPSSTGLTSASRTSLYFLPPPAVSGDGVQPPPSGSGMQQPLSSRPVTVGSLSTMSNGAVVQNIGTASNSSALQSISGSIAALSDGTMSSVSGFQSRHATSNASVNNSLASHSTGQAPSWSNSVQLSQYTTVPGYNMQPQSGDPKYVPNAGTHQAGTLAATQYYQVNSLPGNVTATMDTRTNTFNTTNQYPLASPNTAFQFQSSLNYVPNQPEQKTFANNNANAVLSTEPQNYLNKYNLNGVPVSSGNAYTTVSNSVSSNYGISYNQASYYPPTQSHSMQPHSMYSSAIPSTVHPQGTVPLSSNATFSPQNSSSFTNYMGYQPSMNAANQYSYSAFHNPSFPAHQTIQAITNVPSSSPPLQPLSSQGGQELTSSANPMSENSIRDLITPPLESESAKDSVKDSESALPPVLQPKVIDLNEISQLKEAVHLVKDPLDDPTVCAKFVLEVEKYEKFVEGLVRKSLNGTTPLDQKWKEMIDAQDKESRKMSISVARCYPLKNRFPDVMPYDNNRVKLTSAKDDYINASYLKDICCGSPVFVITQAPMPSTFNDFWLMVWEQQVETLICLLADNELKNHVYFPKERGQVIECGTFEISLHSHKEKNGFAERMVNITHTKNRTCRVVVHLQFTQWPVSGIPQTPAPLLQFISDTLSYQKQQRNLMRPVVVHCSSGIGRSGCFCLVTALVNEMNGGHGPRDVAQVATMVSQQRKFLVQDKDQLKFCYDTVLYYAQDLLMRRGILTSRASFEDKLPGSGNTSSHVRHPSEDFILGSGGLAKLQSGIENMSLDQKDSNSAEILLDTSTSDSQAIGDSDLPVQQATSEDVTVVPPPPLDVDNNKEEVESTSGVSNENSLTALSITSLLDPSNFTLDGTGSPPRRKITKENFANSKGSLSTSSSDSADPLSQLDPLWSLKKQ